MKTIEIYNTAEAATEAALEVIFKQVGLSLREVRENATQYTGRYPTFNEFVLFQKSKTNP